MFPIWPWQNLPTLIRLVPLCLLAATCPARADGGLSEAVIEAAYLYKMADFVTWPPGALASGVFNLCVVGRGPFGPILDRAVRGQTVQGRPVLVRRYRRIVANPGCQLMYVAGSDAQSVADILSVVRGTPVLTVTDAPDTGAIGIINFVLRDGHIRFEIDRQEAAESDLLISSKLLEVAVHGRQVVSP